MKTSTFKGQEPYLQQLYACEQSFYAGGPYWHLCTDGQSTELLFESTDDYRFAMNAVASCSIIEGVRVLTFQLMSNHFHFILGGIESICRSFYDKLIRKLKFYNESNGRIVNWNALKMQLIPIDSLQSLRNEIVYVNRNGYLVYSNYTPFSYPWGAGYLYFNDPALNTSCSKWQTVNYKERERMCRGRISGLPDSLLIADGIILPQSYTAFREGMAMFSNAHQYFSLVSKNFEAYSEVAKRLGDTMILTDDELYSALRQVVRQEYGNQQTTSLPNAAKIELAKRLRHGYNASTGQIQRLLRLDRSIVTELFGR